MNRPKYGLAETESQITAITGKTGGFSRNRWRAHPEQRERVKDLLETRRQILNEMFRPTEENMLRFRAVNDHLFDLTQRLYGRVKALATKLPLVLDCPDFDDDHEIEGTLRYVFNGEESVLRLEDDEYYGSDFILMIKTIADLSSGTIHENIEEIHPHSIPLDDGLSWKDYPFYGRKEFDGIVVCHAVHQLTGHQLYSLPDLLRLNDFWAEARLAVQSITEQDGTRFIP